MMNHLPKKNETPLNSVHLNEAENSSVSDINADEIINTTFPHVESSNSNSISPRQIFSLSSNHDQQAFNITLTNPNGSSSGLSERMLHEHAMHSPNNVLKCKRNPSITSSNVSGDVCSSHADDDCIREGFLAKLEHRGANVVWSKRWALLRKDYIVLFKKKPTEALISPRWTTRITCANAKHSREARRSLKTYSPVLAIVTLRNSSIINSETDDSFPCNNTPDERSCLFGIRECDVKVWFRAPTEKERNAWVVDISESTRLAAPLAASLRRARSYSHDKIHHSRDTEQQSLNITPSNRNRNITQWRLCVSDIDIQQKIGDGQFGEVYQAQLWGTDVAVKTYKSQQVNADVVADLMKEVKIISQLRHPNVVLYIGACTTPPNVCIVTEWCSGGCLNEFLHARETPLSFEHIVSIAMGIARGVNYLHSSGQQIIHRDLKSHNILLTGNMVPKVCDFGLSHARQSYNTATNSSGNRDGGGHYGVFGTPEWMAPEVMEGSSYDNRIDVYSYGIVLTELLTRAIPFRDRYNITDFQDVIRIVLDDCAMPTIPEWCGDSMTDLIERCLAHNPSIRPSFKDIITELRLLESKSSSFFMVFDIPRIVDMLLSNDNITSRLAAKELSALHDARLPVDIMPVVVVRLLALLSSNNASHINDLPWYLKALLRIASDATYDEREILRDILREGGALKRVLQLMAGDEIVLKVAAREFVSKLIRGLPVTVQTKFADFDFGEGDFECSNGLSLLQGLVQSEMSELKTQKLCVERELSLQQQLLRRCDIACKIIGTETRKRQAAQRAQIAGHEPLTALEGLLRGVSNNTLITNADLTAKRRLLPIYQDAESFTICSLIPQSAKTLSEPFVDYFGDHKPVHFDNALMFVNNAENTLCDEVDTEWRKVFLFLFGTDLFVYDEFYDNMTQADNCRHVIYACDSTGALKSISMQKIMPYHHCFSIAGDGNEGEVFTFALRSRIDALRFAHRLNAREYGPPPSRAVLAEQRRIFKRSTRRFRTRQALLTMRRMPDTMKHHHPAYLQHTENITVNPTVITEASAHTNDAEYVQENFDAVAPSTSSIASIHEDERVPLNVDIRQAFEDYFGGFYTLHCGCALRWMNGEVLDDSSSMSSATTDLSNSGGQWFDVWLLACNDVIRIYDCAEDEPDDPLSLLYLTNTSGAPVDVQVLSLYLRPYCIELAEPNGLKACFAFRSRLESLRWAAIVNKEQWQHIYEDEAALL